MVWAALTPTTIRRLNLKTTGMKFASEMLVNSSLNDLNIAEVSTTLSHDGLTRAPHLKKQHRNWLYYRGRGIIAKCVLSAPEIAPRLGIFQYIFDSDKTHFALASMIWMRQILFSDFTQ